MKTKLTPEQSDRLIELGVDPSKASCEQYVDTGKIKNGFELPPQPKPVFILSDILSLLPKEIEIGETMILRIKWAYSAWFASYIDEDGSTTNGFYKTELIDALYELLVWCITNKHIEL